MIHALIEEGMTADQKNNEWTALHWAANEGDAIFLNLKFTQVLQRITSKRYFQKLRIFHEVCMKFMIMFPFYFRRSTRSNKNFS